MTISESWQVIESEMSELSPERISSLRPGATELELAHLEEVVGSKLPSDFREYLSIHNGQEDPDCRLGLVNNNRLQGIPEIIEDYLMLKRHFNDEGPIEKMEPGKVLNWLWRPGWIKFTEFEGDGYVLDLDPGPLGKVGQVFYRSLDDFPEDTLAPTFEKFLAKVANGLRYAEYEMEGQSIVFPDLW